MAKSKNKYLDDLYRFYPISEGPKTNIYFILNEISKKNPRKNRIKIGIAKDVGKRLSQLKTGNPFKMVIIYSFKIDVYRARRLEGALHRIFKRSRVSGEWFVMKPCIQMWIDSHSAENNKRLESIRHNLSNPSCTCYNRTKGKRVFRDSKGKILVSVPI